jgi:hypothetical protein
VELTFTDAYTAAFTDATGGSGTFSFAPAEDTAPASLDGNAWVATSFVNSNFISTNSFDKTTFSATDNLGRSASGAYTFTRLTPVAALLLQTYSDTSEMAGITNYSILTFAGGAAHGAGVYYAEHRNASGKLTSDIGSFK